MYLTNAKSNMYNSCTFEKSTFVKQMLTIKVIQRMKCKLPWQPNYQKVRDFTKKHSKLDIFKSNYHLTANFVYE